MVSIAGHFNWTHAVYFGFFAFIMPVYFLIFVCLLKLRTSDALFKTTFYAILLQHSLADIIAMGLYAFQKISYILIPEFIYTNQETLASFFYNCFFWFIIIRSNGVALMTIHRYLIIVKSNSNFSLAIQRSRSFLVWIIYWIPAAFFDGVFYSDPTIRFDSVENLKNVVKPETTLTEMMVYIRDFFPLANGLLSFISPFTIILFNKDLTRRIRTMITGQKIRVLQENQSEVSAKISVRMT
ncbi:hypothetical protein CAEBREN_14363 [Caenorhabditis brenneri]|uniref:G-protein coupled receptors family 1 profile domain-containing protein n=1 Tax=Caenorhabditis brenneri TaxID=135651 RepID=G0NA55_CAEBE|nr:hypothetical protein CAEBREN_14363 [Caenorhabditis brenneri]